ncbi:alpha/beta hydrolase [Oceanobacillus sp. CFH 90083]|uniref:alpha/beta hydrolase n=1 Tax=Oceanobacillus sp. CFH 90083 TaxID=2592336 RepID=UPI0018834DEC|nr:alpha/beta fold hydrolase [Oceanobacillus sp. CFH 90083]
MKNTSITKFILILAILLMVGGSIIGKIAHTDGGDINVKDISFVTEDGAELRGILYIPKSASEENKLPAIVASHGYNNTAELQAINAIELARRGTVVIAIDNYGHGLSTFPDENINDGIAADLGTYSALQYLGTLPYVDVDRVGMVGHSMGGSAIQNGALRAYQNHAEDPSIVVPTAVLPTAQAFSVNEEATESILSAYPVNLGTVYGQYDEWAEGMWGVKKGSDINTSPVAAAALGFETPDFDTYYSYGENIEIDREGAVAAAETGEFRVMYSPAINHPAIHFSKNAASSIIDFFDITLLNGESERASTDQIWLWKEIGTGIGLIGFFLFIPSLGLLLLSLPFFRTIVQKEPESISVINNGKDRFIYMIFFVLALLPSPFLYVWTTGYPIDIKAMGRTVPTVFPANEIFPMPIMNGLVLFNVLSALVILLFFVVVYFTIAKRQSLGSSGLGIRLPFNEILKALLLAVVVFGSAYAFLVLAHFLFLSDFRFYVFSVKALTPEKFWILIKYIPFFAVFFITSSLTLNLTTRIKGASEWKNIILILIASSGSLFILFALDYIALYTTGIKMFETIPYPEGTTSALAGVLLWGLLFILPIAAIYARIFFRKTGSIWVGGFINSFVVTFFAMSNTVIAAGIL